MIPPGSFYDGFARKLLRDYVVGNRRMEAAVRFAVSAAPDTISSILDIGSGIGWSSWELFRVVPGNRVVGMDLSHRLTSVASRLFGDGEGIRFEHGDFTSTSLTGPFDFITMLDVFEHFPRDARAQVNMRLASLLGPNGQLALTVPSVSHQAYLRREHPDGLQPVDEDVTEADLKTLARDVGGELVELRSVSIWNPGDYVHALIVRPNSSPNLRRGVQLEVPEARARRVRTRLGVRWSESCGFLSARSGPRICIVGGSEGVSETFIQAQREGLEGVVQCLVGDPRPNRTENGQTLIPAPLGYGLKVYSLISGWTANRSFDTAAARLPRDFYDRLVARYLKRAEVDVVLAEYGPSAVAVRRACELAKVPLVAHFHGYDAFRTTVLEAFAEEYRQVFSLGFPVVVVSGNMARQLERLGAREDQVFVIPCGVDTDMIRPGHPEKDTVLAVGRLVDKKAPHLTVRAFAQVVRALPDSRLRIVGDGPLRRDLEQLIQELGLGENVEMLGGLSHQGVVGLLRTTRVFAQHSVVAPDGDREGTPLSVLEAMAAGIPVVSTRHEGIGDAVVEGITGFLVEEGDVDGMARHLVYLLQNPDSAQSLGRAGRARAKEHFSLTKSLSELSGVLGRTSGRWP